MLRVTLPLLLLLPTAAVAQKVTVTGGKHDATNVVVTVPGAKADANTLNVGAGMVPAQASAAGLVAVLPKVKTAESLTLTPATVNYFAPPPAFSFKEIQGEHVDLLFDKRPVLRYVNKPHDPKAHYLTFKPFHQVFDPRDGKVMLSSGAYPDPKDGQFPHHRGLFFGFNKISYEQDGKKLTPDIWHGTNNVFSTADKTSNSEAGEVFARQTSNISWHGADGKKFADETRTVTVYHVPDGTMLDWSTELTTKLDKVRLDGDPQHAGFHFRATQEVSKSTAKQTYYLRPDGKGKEGETRNWDAKAKEIDKRTINLTWNAMSFVTNGKRYTALRINHPDNPKDTRGSERDYGRFGDYFEFDLTPKTPLKLKYRVWVQEGEMTVEQCEAMAHGFTDAVTVKAEK
jgi:hypothetical protein